MPYHVKYNINLFAGVRKQLLKEIKKPEDWPPPKKCVFCSRKIEEEDFYLLGYTRGRIFAETCDCFNCKKWFIGSVRLRKRTKT